jgi:hypothetical protein
MSTIHTHSPELAATAAPSRQDTSPNLSFNQRHAWLREYEHAEHGASIAAQNTPASHGHHATGGEATHPLNPPSTTDAATLVASVQMPRRREPTLAAMGHTTPAAHAASPETARMPFTPAALWLEPQSTSRTPAAIAAAAALASPRARQGDAAERPVRQLTVYRDGDALTLTVRDAALTAADGVEILRELHASGATHGIQHLSLTLNGRSIEPRAGHPQE